MWLQNHLHTSVLSFAALLVCSAFQEAPCAEIQVLYSFSGGGDGGRPAAPYLYRDDAGNLYGTTQYGGDTSSCTTNFPGCGVVFKISPSGNESVLHTFNGSDGNEPLGGVIRDNLGNLYGTTTGGGSYGGGTVFKISRHGRFSVLHSFLGGNEGCSPSGRLALDAEGNLYGIAGCGASGNGVVYELSHLTLQVLYSFKGGIDGGEPEGGVIRDNGGNIYGTTFSGGLTCSLGWPSPGSCGTVFKIAPNGKETVLHHFRGRDGANPQAPLIEDGAGNLYGTTRFGGRSTSCWEATLGCGTVFKIAQDGSETVLYWFKDRNDGHEPSTGLMMDVSGNLYGTVEYGGEYEAGLIYEITSGGTPKLLYSFTGGNDGAGPVTGLIADSEGNLYGATEATNLTYPLGTVFKLTP